MKKQLLLAATLFAVLFSACDKDEDKKKEDDHDHENELITTMKITFSDTTTQDIRTFSWRQPGGPGTVATVDTIKLAAGKTYMATVELKDESKNPVVDVTGEIVELKNEHLFIYTSSTTRLTAVITDFDTNNPPMEVGLKWNAITTTNGDSEGTFRAVLRHYTTSDPKRNGPNAGSSDIDVTFPLIVQ